MSSFYQSVISIISKPKEKRQDDEIHMILAWFINLFKKKSSLFGDIEPGLNFCAKIMQFWQDFTNFFALEIIKELIKNCSFETKKTDEIIIRQGDIGDW